MPINHILICSDQYPTKEDPVFSFVEQAVNAFAKLGVRVTVVAPQSLTKHFLRKTPLHPRYRKVQSDNGTLIEIFQPYKITLGNRFPKINSFCEKMVLWRVLKKLDSKPQACYGHFWHCAISLYNFASKEKIPLFVASGEASVKSETDVTKDEINDFLSYYSGVFFASSKNRRECEKLGFLTNQRNVVLPNAINPNLFFLKDKRSLRRDYNISQESFIVIFVGGFIERKGPNRVAEALRMLNNSHIKAFFVGREHDGCKFTFDYEEILFKGVVPHEKLVDYLNMADVFVLPTLAEGCCNAIIEAMACGLPIVSSNLSFNDDVLDDSNSICVNPNSIDDIASAIKRIYENPIFREKMGVASLEKASCLTIDNRAKAILRFMEDCMEN